MYMEKATTAYILGVQVKMLIIAFELFQFVPN